MSKGQKFLKVTSILMIVGGALAGVTCLLGIAGVAMLASLADGHAAALMLYLALALALAAGPPQQRLLRPAHPPRLWPHWWRWGTTPRMLLRLWPALTKPCRCRILSKLHCAGFRVRKGVT